MGSHENCCAHCPDDGRPSRVTRVPDPPRFEIGPAVVILGLGGVGLGISTSLAIFWHLAAGLILGVPILWWFLQQLWGEITLEWECKRPLPGVQAPAEQVIQEPSATLVPVRFNSRLPNATLRPRKFNSRRPDATSTPRMLHSPPPLIAQAEVIEVRRER